MSTRPLLVVDGDSLAHRAFHGLPKSTLDGAGRPANMLVGIASMLTTLWDATTPRTILTCWDTLTSPTYRHEALPEYQSGREFDPELVEQLERLPGLSESFGFPVAKAPGFEADDFLAAAATAETAASGTTKVVTSDRDSFQLVSDSVEVLLPKRGVAEVERVRAADVVERYGVLPEQVVDFIALRGDPSDRIPGARGIGKVRAAALLKENGSLEAILAAGRFEAEADALRLYRTIATMQADAPLPPLPTRSPNWTGAANWSREAGLDSLAIRLDLRR
jgi:DNA polymerase-1